MGHFVLLPRRRPVSDSSIEIRKLTPHIGAEIFGVDLARPLDEATFKAVHDALIDNFWRARPVGPMARGDRPAAGP
jgi:hypothetical protein